MSGPDAISGMPSGAGSRAPARLLAVALLCMGASLAHAADADVTVAAALRATHAALQDRLGDSPFRRPLVLQSSESPGDVSGVIQARLDHPFATVLRALNDPRHWCDILSLHHNIKYCRAASAGSGDALNVSIGKKYDQPLDDASWMAFAYRVAARSHDYLQIRLDAAEGPFGTRDYHIVVEAIPLDNGQTFIRLAYSYGYGTAGRVAMEVYLATGGRDKVGFTVSGVRADGQPLYIGGMRGLVERNAMRYFLAIEAFLGALSAPQQAQFEKRLRDWFAAVERYPRQLHEMEQGAYLEMKRREYQRQQVDLPARRAG